MHLDPELVNAHLLSAIHIAVPDPIVMNQIAAAALGISEALRSKKQADKFPLSRMNFWRLPGPSIFP